MKIHVLTSVSSVVEKNKIVVINTLLYFKRIFQTLCQNYSYTILNTIVYHKLMQFLNFHF